MRDRSAGLRPLALNDSSATEIHGFSISCLCLLDVEQFRCSPIGSNLDSRSPMILQGTLPVLAVRASVALAAALISFTFVPEVHAQGPSFNCVTDTRPDERTVCASAALSQLDRQLSTLYFALRDGLDAGQQAVLRDGQRNWIRERQICGANAACISALYQRRISQLQQMMAGRPAVTPAPDATPTRPPASGGTRDACDAFPTLC